MTGPYRGVLTEGVSRAAFLLQAQGECVSVPFMASEACLWSLPCGPFLHFKGRSDFKITLPVSVCLPHLCFHPRISSVILLPPSDEDNCDEVGPPESPGAPPVSRSLTPSRLPSPLCQTRYPIHKLWEPGRTSRGLHCTPVSRPQPAGAGGAPLLAWALDTPAPPGILPF